MDRALTQFYEETLAAALADPAAAGVKERQVRDWFDKELITEAGTRGLVHQGENETGGLPNSAVLALQRRFLVRAEARGGERGSSWCMTASWSRFGRATQHGFRSTGARCNARPRCG